MYTVIPLRCAKTYQSPLTLPCYIPLPPPSLPFLHPRYHFRRHFFQHVGFRYVALPASTAANATTEAFPGAATAANLWEGSTTPVLGDLTDGYAPAGQKVGRRRWWC